MRGYSDNKGFHTDFPKKEHREDKYGQVIRLTCSCGIKTNWHTELWKADIALNQLHADKGIVIF